MEDFAGDPIWSEGLGIALDNLLTAFSELRDGVETIADAVDRRSRRAARPAHRRARGVVRRLDSAAAALTAALKRPGGPPAVRWLERRGRARQHRARGGAADLATLLKDNLFDRVETVCSRAHARGRGRVLVSRGAPGLDLPPSRVVVREALRRPSISHRSACSAFPPIFPSRATTKRARRGRRPRTGRAGARLRRGIFCLFTSHGALRRAADTVRPQLAGRWPLLVQGDVPRDLLLRRFREAGSAILLGTDSFWEGVDVPDGRCALLILAKLRSKCRPSR